MRTNIEIDEVLMTRFMAAAGVKTKREAVDTALREGLRLRQQEALMGLWGLGWEGERDERRDTSMPAFD